MLECPIQNPLRRMGQWGQMMGQTVENIDLPRLIDNALLHAMGQRQRRQQPGQGEDSAQQKIREMREPLGTTLHRFG